MLWLVRWFLPTWWHNLQTITFLSIQSWRVPLIWCKRSEGAAVEWIVINDMAKNYLFVRCLPYGVTWVSMAQIGKNQDEFGLFCCSQTWNKRGWGQRREAAKQRKECMVRRPALYRHWGYFWASWEDTCGFCHLSTLDIYLLGSLLPLSTFPSTPAPH